MEPQQIITVTDTVTGTTYSIDPTLLARTALMLFGGGHSEDQTMEAMQWQETVYQSQAPVKYVLGGRTFTVAVEVLEGVT
ncbi:MAG: hypothetical protein V3U76_07275 [Granulosicoccus sp.]